MPSLKWYLASTRGRALGDIWTDVARLEASSKERVGYPTQKPLALLERIVLASSHEDAVVFDPFCGCATTLVAAEKHGREWVGIDLSEKALELVDYRLREQHGVFGQIIGRSDIPSRTDLGKLPHYTTHRKALYGEQGGYCNGCGHHYVPRTAGGRPCGAQVTRGTRHAGEPSAALPDVQSPQGDEESRLPEGRAEAQGDGRAVEGGSLTGGGVRQRYLRRSRVSPRQGPAVADRPIRVTVAMLWHESRDMVRMSRHGMNAETWHESDLW